MDLPSVDEIFLVRYVLSLDNLPVTFFSNSYSSQLEMTKVSSRRKFSLNISCKSISNCPIEINVFCQDFFNPNIAEITIKYLYNVKITFSLKLKFVF